MTGGDEHNGSRDIASCPGFHFIVRIFRLRDAGWLLAVATLSVAPFVAMYVQYMLAGGALAVLMTAEVTLLGAVLMWLYIKSGSIWPSIAVNVANNAFAFLVLLVVF